MWDSSSQALQYLVPLVPPGGNVQYTKGECSVHKGGNIGTQRGNVRYTGTPQKPSKIKGSRGREKSNTSQDFPRSLNRDILPYPSGGKNPQESDIMYLASFH